jgi:hypothetical protein
MCSRYPSFGGPHYCPFMTSAIGFRNLQTILTGLVDENGWDKPSPVSGTPFEADWPETNQTLPSSVLCDHRLSFQVPKGCTNMISFQFRLLGEEPAGMRSARIKRS